MQHYFTMLRLFEHLTFIKDSTLFTDDERRVLLRELRAQIPHPDLTPGTAQTRLVLLNHIEKLMRPNVSVQGHPSPLPDDPSQPEDGPADSGVLGEEEAKEPPKASVLNHRRGRVRKSRTVGAP